MQLYKCPECESHIEDEDECSVCGYVGEMKNPDPDRVREIENIQRMVKANLGLKSNYSGEERLEMLTLK